MTAVLESCVESRKRRERWLLWCAAIGFVLTSALVVWSEVAGFYYNEKPYGEGNFFMLDRSAVAVTCTQGDDNSFFSGIPLYLEGWNRTGALQHSFVPREWWPRVGRWDWGGRTSWHVRLPLWMPAGVFALAGWWGWRVSRRFGPGRCAGCGYDVRGLVGGVCPECGAGADRPVAAND